MYCLGLYQLNHLIDRLGTVPGVFLAGLMVSLFLLSFGRAGRWIVMCVLLFCSTLSFDARALEVPLIPPLGDIRFEAEPLTLIFMFFLILPSMFSKGIGFRTPLLAATVAFWILEMIHSARWASNIDLEHGLLSMVIFTTILIVMGYAMPRWFRGVSDVHSAARCLGGVAILFLIGTLAQLMVNRSAIVFNGRLFAITGNPQHAAFMLAIFLVPVCLLLTTSRESKSMRIVWGAAAGLIVVMLIWTGSRTGALTALIGVGLLFRRRMGRFLGAGLVATIFVFFFLAFFQLDVAGNSRIVSTQDTRSGVWARQFAFFLENPLVGEMSKQDRGGGENSYLTIAARMGMVGVGILTIVIGLIFAACLRLRRLRAALQNDDDRMLADWVPAGLTAIFMGAFFEATLVGTIILMLLSIHFYLGILKFLSDKNTIEMAEGQLLPVPSDYSQVYETGSRNLVLNDPLAF